MTTPALCAVSGCSIFIASSTTTRSPAATVSPSATAILTIVPCIGRGQRVPGGRRRALRRWPIGAAWPGRLPAGADRGGTEPGGQATSSRLAADLDHDVSRVASSASPSAAGAGERRDRVVELGLDPPGVHAERRRRSAAVNAGSARPRGGTAARSAMPVDRDLVQRPAGPLQRLLPVRAGDDQLGQQRVEVAADDTAPDSTPASTRTPGPAGGDERGHRAGRRQEAAARVLAVDPELDRVPARRRVVGEPSFSPSAMRNCSRTRSMPRGLLGDRVLDLQPGVDLEEGDRAVRRRPGTRRCRRRR